MFPLHFHWNDNGQHRTVCPIFFVNVLPSVFVFIIFSIIIFPFFWSPSRESFHWSLSEHYSFNQTKMGTSSFIGYLYITFSFLFAKSLVITVLFYRKKRFNMMQPTTRSIPNKYHCLSLLFSLPILLWLMPNILPCQARR